LGELKGVSPLLFPEAFELHPRRYESYLRENGYVNIAGTDEAGRGSLAGPVAAAAVILPENHRIRGIKDSKLLTPFERERLYDKIVERALAFAVALVEAEEIDRINIHHASLKAMSLAIQQLKTPPSFLLVDGIHKVPLFMPQRPVIKGDFFCQSIAASSILAKVTRDRLMVDLERHYPQFSFSVHKGYPTHMHREQIRKFGPCAIHRKSFSLYGTEIQDFGGEG
jgi:ribonuclease HII